MEEEFSSTWGGFFPTISAAEVETFVYPVPLSDDYWRLYSEPAPSSIDGADGSRYALTRLISSSSFYRREGSHMLQALLSVVGPSFRLLESGKVRQQWTSHSLLGSFALMALLDLSEGRRLLRCPADGRVFVASAWQRTYCSTQCRQRMQQRRYRASKKRTD